MLCNELSNLPAGKVTYQKWASLLRIHFPRFAFHNKPLREMYDVEKLRAGGGRVTFPIVKHIIESNLVEIGGPNAR
jgi:hypothetical protein